MRRKASFIGSVDWRKRDVAVSTHDDPYDIGMGNIRLTDKPTGIWVQVREEPSTECRAECVYADLAHRVIQLTT